MASDSMNSKYSLKNMLFSRAIPNHVIPCPTDGYKIYGCIDCGDKFLFKSSYDSHVNRKSVKITYICRHCHQTQIFKNRCNLLCHIRSHAFKTATINVGDLKVEPLPLSDYLQPQPSAATKPKEVQPANPPANTESESQTIVQTSTTTVAPNAPLRKVSCYECGEDIGVTMTQYKDRAAHYMRYTNKLHTCQICLFVLPTSCALEAHTRIHDKIMPFYCPECGMNLSNKSIEYPYMHDCEGFKMMRATTRRKCPSGECGVFHPNEFRTHMLEHLKKVYKCPVCIVACFNVESIRKHLASHNGFTKTFLLFYQCQMCPGRLVLHNQIDTHLATHMNTYVYPCWSCGMLFPKTSALLQHHANLQCKGKSKKPDGQDNNKYRVVKRCVRCKLFFTYKCTFEEIACLPSECPYKCSPGDDVMEVCKTLQGQDSNTNTHIICHLCNNKISSKWDDIKVHYAGFHKEHRCIDLNVRVKNLTKNSIKKKCDKLKGIKKTGKSKRHRRSKNSQKQAKLVTTEVEAEPSTSSPSRLVCKKCSEEFESKEKLEEHIVTHRDPCTAYQCLECGECFVVRPSFAMHLIIEHRILEIDEYIKSKNCYNENAFERYQTTVVADVPLRDNQCNICLDQFENHEDLDKHYRVHGMAFLLKNTQIKSSP
ncbi:zinc finger protein 532 [Plutella xylostella]|uniref:zinc finger protein 532 n=1 Tax=Plutella xylostella TaxID=51655 RepID=UPI002032256C|nr:zinc finger protein 532 [Plutella xylostella]XP_037968884.2 zinc finger protein 532 [Plutella xylostella]XP_048489358.1 zinc finger protein 532 [Plutella xylostella]